MAAPFVFRSVFNDFEQLKKCTPQWNLDWKQLDRGPLAASVSLAGTGSALVSHSVFNRAFEQHGAAPPGGRTFGLLERGIPETRWCGRLLLDDQVNVFDRTGEFDAVSGPHFGNYTVALAEDRVAEVCRDLEAPGLERQLEDGSARVFACDPEAVEGLRHLLRQVREAAEGGAALGSPSGLWDELESEIPAQLLAVLASGHEAARVPSFGTRELALRRARPFIEANGDRPITVPELCRATRLSRRTLEYAFREHLGLSPRAYLAALRLDGVRRELVPADAPVRVSDVANRWGFWHLGQFAADYRKQFGELPSKTLRRRGAG